MTNGEKFNQLLNRCRNSRAVYAVLLELGTAGVLDRLKEEAAHDQN